MRQPLFRLWIAAGSAAGLLGVAMAAFTAHAQIDPEARTRLHSADEMQLWHALALVGVGLWVRAGGGALAEWAGAAFLLGLIGFCGGVYCLALLDLRLPMVAPTGGTLLMIGWALLGLSALRAR
jgi:uncharacterized membrane protein YgdD (TMEM256/DUF423 family)